MFRMPSDMGGSHLEWQMNHEMLSAIMTSSDVFHHHCWIAMWHIIDIQYSVKE